MADRGPHARGGTRDGAARGGGWMGTEFEVSVGPVAHGGHCVARHEGRVVFVRHTLPGERVVVRVTEDRHPGFCRADAIEILEASPDRVDGDISGSLGVPGQMSHPKVIEASMKVIEACRKHGKSCGTQVADRGHELKRPSRR